MRYPHGVTVTVTRAQRDRYGDTVSETTHTIEGCARAPRSSGGTLTELTDQRNTVIVGETLYAPAGADITAIDVVTFPDGTRWQVEGQPGEWSSPFSGWSPGVEVALSRVMG